MIKKQGRNLIILLPGRTLAALDELCLNLQVGKTAFINTLVYANPDFKSGPITEATVVKDPDKKQICVRLSPYADALAKDISRKQHTYPGSWLKKLLITKMDETIGGQNVFCNSATRHPELPEAVKRQRDKDNSRCGDEGQWGGSTPPAPKKQLGDWLRDCSR